MMVPHFLSDALSEAVKRGQVRELHFASSGELGGFEVKTSECHLNVERWLISHPGHRHAKGWLVLPGDSFIRHSVVDRGESKLLDITLPAVSPSLFAFHSVATQLPFDNFPPADLSTDD